jgi:dTDP-4-amino-4,6-dideoxygalactose transaminase
MKIGFNKPYFTGKEFDYIKDAISMKHISGNGYYTKKCQSFFEERYGFKKCLLTTSCTDALEMSAILIGIKPGDEVILPSFTFVSTANAFILRGAKVVFVDSRSDHPGMDESKVEELISPKTKAIVVVHYAGAACDMGTLMDIAKKYGLFVIEDAAQAIDSYYMSKPLGSIGHLGCFSFHETKNISCGEGGMLVINDNRFLERAEIIWEKGTNRAAFFRGEVDKYGWVDIGSSFLPSDIIAAILWAQLENLDQIQEKRLEIWKNYMTALVKLNDRIGLPEIPGYATNSGHMFYIILEDVETRNKLIQYLKEEGIIAVFHYQALHNSRFYTQNKGLTSFHFAEHYTQNLLRLPLYVELEEDDQEMVIEQIFRFYKSI